MMKTFLVAIVGVSLGACASPEERKKTAIIDKIEAAIKLPTGARPLNHYARAYAFDTAGRIHAVYFVPWIDNDFCTETKKGGPENSGQVALACPPPDGMKPGNRRWFASPYHLPLVNDGGCNYIDVEADPGRLSTMSVRCHG